MRRSTWPSTRRSNQRGYYTSFIQTTATLGLLLSLIVILSVQGYVNGNYPDEPMLDAAGAATMNADGTPAMMKAFNAWGWRIPFLGSIFLLLISLYIRLQMNESPAFKKMKEEGAASKAPLREAFGQWKNAKIALIALFGLVAGQAVVWYSGQFYALFFLQNVIKRRQLHGQRPGGLVADPRHRRLPVLRLAVGPHRPQADHPGGLPDRGDHLLPGVQDADAESPTRRSTPPSRRRSR